MGPVHTTTAAHDRASSARERTRMITSSRNPAVQAARKLARPQGRAAAGSFLIEGVRSVRAALGAGARMATLLVTREAAERHPDLLAGADRAGAKVLSVSDQVLAGVAQTVSPQGVVAVVADVVRPLTGLPGTPRLVAVLAEVRDPGNLGTVLRAADAFGADAVVTTAGSTDPQGPKAARASAGSLFHLPVIAGVTWTELAGTLAERGVVTVGADPHASATVDEAPLEGPVAVVLGNEAHGLSPEIRSSLDHLVRLPHYGRAESLNLAAAGAVFLYEAARRQRLASTPRGWEATVG